MKQREESYEKANAARVRVEIWAHLGYLCQEGPTQGGRRLVKSFFRLFFYLFSAFDQVYIMCSSFCHY